MDLAVYRRLFASSEKRIMTVVLACVAICSGLFVWTLTLEHRLAFSLLTLQNTDSFWALREAARADRSPSSRALGSRNLVTAISRNATPNQVLVISLSVDEASSKSVASSVSTVRGSYAAIKSFLSQMQSESDRILIRDLNFRRMQDATLECRVTFLVIPSELQ
jgi:hypothetical protein